MQICIGVNPSVMNLNFNGRILGGNPFKLDGDTLTELDWVTGASCLNQRISGSGFPSAWNVIIDNNDNGDDENDDGDDDDDDDDDDVDGFPSA